MSFLLKITAGKNTGSEFTLRDGKNLVGRSRSSDIRVFNEDVSGKHFSIDINGETATLNNISGYGTRVDGVLVHQSIELASGQVIEAGNTLKFIFEATGSEEASEAENNTLELTGVTKFVGDAESSEESADSSEMTSVTRFSDEQTAATKFSSDLPVKEEEDAEESIEETSVTKFASDIPVKEEDAEESIEETSVTKFASGIPDEKKDGDTDFNKTNISSSASETLLETSFSAKTGRDETVVSDSTRMEYTEMGDKTKADGSFTSFAKTLSEDSTASGTEDYEDEQGVFFADDDLAESEKTNANETQIVQTRMASMEEINFIKGQIKKQQQGRLLFKFLLFSLFVVLLGIIWMLRAPQQEKILSWPQKSAGVYLTDSEAAFGQGAKQGFFDVYYPQWANAKVMRTSPDSFEIHSYLGKKADVPLVILVQREVSDEFVYEKRTKALQSMLRRLSERKNEQFNFDSTPTTEFLRPAAGQSENGIMVDKLAYQRDTGHSFFGILRFFRHGRVNYIIRVEVPAEEKLRAFPILNTETFLIIAPLFVRSHWEGHDEYTKSHIAGNIVGVKDELQRDSPMQYPRLEREIKSILAQALYEKNTSVYKEAREMLLNLRSKQQRWYNGQKIRWFSAIRENNNAEKLKIRNDCEAVFSVIGDKRRYDILRDHWE